ncbi:hypothetical protein H012_gp782 [Acanthamoeba polyphaga moumouvirus]|uniref:Uncharacterized protein n=1 Tax=Acanthamoeba polyphaga moumouvirus TaxID=1269028 RepID=L7RCI2_9VIRU|nr:hypothetical protein H012_gp782 [Acanthamoeba polyphaga moumouvirus]AGC01683.1 hypothetical protein Moumou_00139 [Acanthamoeba polyphaga moumouvirus]
MTTIKYGDTIFITLPLVSNPMIFNGSIPHYTGQNHFNYVPLIIPGSIIDGDPYIIEPVNNETNGSDISENSIFRLKQINQNNYLYDMNSIVAQGNITDTRANWRLLPTNNSINSLTYSQEFHLINQNTGGYAVLEINSNIPMLVTKSSDTTNNSIFKFLPGPLSYAITQCCQNNNTFTQPNMCGDYISGSQNCNTSGISLSTQVNYIPGISQTTTTTSTNNPTGNHTQISSSTSNINNTITSSATNQIETLTNVNNLGTTNTSHRVLYIIGGIILFIIILIVIIILVVKLKNN